LAPLGRALALLLAGWGGLAAAAAQGQLPGVGLDYFPSQADPWAGGTLNQQAFIDRYASTIEESAYWRGMTAELFFVNDRALRNAFQAGVLGDRAMYNGVPKLVEQFDISRMQTRPQVIKGQPGEKILYDPDNFYCKWWQNQLPYPGQMPHNPIEVSDPTRPEGLFHAPPETGWACPVYYWNVLPDEQPPPPPPCEQDGDTLCLRDRFEIEIGWETDTGATGIGHAIPLTDDTGTFWFFNEKNLELLIKVLDGCVVNQHYWVFAGGLTNVQVQIRVKDTDTGAVQVYNNPIKTPFIPLQDINAFDCP
jgi:hypothetical protein